jgi:hypothetical protein
VFEERDSLLGLAFGAVDGGKLGEEAWVVGVGFEGAIEEGFGLGGLVLGLEGVGQAGGGVGVGGG